MLGKSQLIFLGRKVLRAWGQGWGHVYPAPWSGKSWRVRVQILLKDSTSFQGLSVSTREQPGARVRRSEGKSCGDEADRPAASFRARCRRRSSRRQDFRLTLEQSEAPHRLHWPSNVGSGQHCHSGRGSRVQPEGGRCWLVPHPAPL